MEVSNNLPSDLSWFNPNRYIPCEEWDAKTWFLTLKARKLCYETIRSHMAIYGEVHPAFNQLYEYRSIFYDPQKILDAQEYAREHEKAFLQKLKTKKIPCVTPLSFYSATNLSAMIDGYSEAFMEPSYSIMQSRCGTNLKPDSPWREELVRDGVKVTERTELEKCRMFLGYQGIEFPEDHSVIYDIDLKRLPVDAVLKGRHSLQTVHLSVDLDADDETLEKQFKECISKMREMLKHNSERKPLNKNTFQKWRSKRLLPYLDVYIFNKVCPQGLNDDEDIFRIIFPNRNLEDMKSQAKRTQKYATSIISDKVLNNLKVHCQAQPNPFL